MIQISLFILQLIRKPIEWMGADYRQLRLILKTKLTLDFRRSPTSFNSRGNKKQTFKSQLIVFAIMGLFISFGFFAVKDLMLSFTIAYSVIMVMLATTLIGEFTSVLFDHRDNQIILVRPVNNRTLLLSRILHILFYIMYISMALSLISTVVSFIKFGASTAIFYFIGTMLCAWIAVLFTTLFYFITARFVSAERFKDIVSYIQIFLAIIIMGGYQLLPRMMNIQGITEASLEIHPYTYLIPPAWLAAWVQLSIPKDVNVSIIFLAILAVLFSIAGGILLVRFLSAGFSGLLAFSAESGTDEKKKITKEKTRPTKGIYRYLCVSEAEKSGWKLALLITKRDRKFKQAVYPTYGLMLVMAVVFLKPDFNNMATWYQNLTESSRYLIVIFFGFFATACVEQIKYTDTPEAGWIYKALPFQKQGHLLSGAVKAVIMKFFFPVYILLAIATSIVWGIHVLPLMFLGAALIISSTLITLNIQNKAMPFTQAREMQQKSGNFLKIIIGSLVMGAIIGGVYLASYLPAWSILPIGIFVLFINSLIFKNIRNTNFIIEG